MKQSSKTLLFILLCWLPLHTVFADELPLPNKPHLLIEGHGLIEQVPDIVLIRFDVSATEKNLSLAKQTVDNIIGKAIRAARKQQVKKDDINASKIQASPQYEWRNQSRIYTGERVSRQVEIKLLDADRYNALVEALLAAGVTRLQPVQLDFSDRKNLEAKALTLALDDARQQAETIARHIGTPLGNVFQVTPITHQAGIPHMAMGLRAEKSSDEAELKPGKQPLEQRVRVIYLLGPQPNR